MVERYHGGAFKNPIDKRSIIIELMTHTNFPFVLPRVLI